MRLVAEIFIGVVYCALLIASLASGSDILGTVTLLLGAVVAVTIFLARRSKESER
jgi:hypothetical protein